jgi:hypothetical protein
MEEELTIPSTDQKSENEPEDTFFQWYSSILTDYIHKMTIASVLFFVSYPWAAFLWAPYYFMRRWTDERS